MTSGAAPCAIGELVEEPALLRDADVVRRDGRARFHVRAHDLRGIADQEYVDERMNPVVLDVIEQMMRHVLLIPERPALGRGAGKRVGHATPVGLAGRDDLVAARMIGACVREVMRVERLVRHRAIAAVLPRTHHRGRDVARPRPHRDAQRIGHAGARRAPTSRATSAL